MNLFYLIRVSIYCFFCLYFYLILSLSWSFFIRDWSIL